MSFTRGRPSGSPAAAFGGVDRLPAGVVDELHPSGGEEVVERRPGAGMCQPAGPRILEQQIDGLGRVLLVRPDHAARAALDPARDVGALGSDDPSSVVRDRPTALVERNAGQGDALVADATQNEPRRDQLRCAGRASDDASVLLDELVAHHLDRLDAVAADNRHRRDEEPEDDPARLARRRALGELAEQLVVAPRALAVLLERALARRVEPQVVRVDDHVGAGELAELLQLGRREGRLHRPAAAEHHDLLEAGTADRVDRLGRRIGRRELLGRQCEHPGAVDRHVPVPDHHGSLVGEVEHAVLEVGMAVVPGDELGRRPRSREVLAGDSQAPIGLGADRVDDSVVVSEELRVADRRADLDVAQEAEARSGSRLLEGA